MSEKMTESRSFGWGGSHGTSWAVKSLARAGGLAVAAACVLCAFPAAAQPPAPTTPSTPAPRTPAPGTPTPGTPIESPTGVVEGPTPSGTLPGVQIPGVLLPPRSPLDFLYAPPAQGPLAVTPSLTITEQFNDNVFLTHSNKSFDFITQFSPMVMLQAQQPGFQLLSSFSFTAEIYAKNTELDSAANQLSFLTALSYQATPGVALSLTDGLTYSRNSNLAAISGVSSGRERSWSNVFAPGATVQLTPRTTWRVSGGYTLERFGSGTNSQNSDLYRIGTGFGYTLTPRLTLTADYNFGYFDVEHQPTAFNHTLRFGGTYQLTPTLSVTATAGPSLTLSNGDTEVTPAATASIAKQMSWGSISAFYDQAIGTNGGFGGITNNQSFGGSLAVTTLMRGLFIILTPRYSITKTTSATTGASKSNTDIDALTVSLSARYQIARYVGLVGSYQLFHQTGSGGGRTSNSLDVDQNLVTFGVQFGYPINLY